jgi:5-methylcytosine-specific restriction enzyme subunit McrC
VIPPPTIVLSEDDKRDVRAELDGPRAAALESTGLVRVRPVGNAVWELIPRGRVGAVRIDDVDIVVTPKVGIARLLFLLGYAADPGFRPEVVDGVPDDDLWPALAETLCRHAERAVMRGILQGYETREEALPLVRGRVRIGDQLARRPGMLLPIEVRYDEYDVDIAENQILRAALRRMLSVPRVAPAVRARLSHLDGRLDGVTPLIAGTPVPSWRPSRLNGQYHAALRLSEIVLRHQSFEVGPGGVSVAAFVVDMARVFEDFVATALREAWHSRPGRTWPQYPTSLDTDDTVRMKVDVVHLVDGVPRIIADAKYKLESSAGSYPNADQYQVLAYCTALQVPVGWLVYAEGSRGAVLRQVRNTGISIVEYPLDLSAPPLNLLEQVAALAAEAWAAG